MSLWRELDTSLKVFLTAGAVVAMLWSVFGILDTGNKALAESRRAQKKVQRLETRYNRHIDSAFKAWQMQKAPPVLAQSVTTTTLEGNRHGMD